MQPFLPFFETDTFYMQISGNGQPGNFFYHGCMRWDPIPPGEFFTGTDPTPVTCFTYQLSVSGESYAGALDGSIVVEMVAGDPPYSIQWGDGGAGFTRSGLGAGNYAFTITDAGGCAETDTALVVEDSATGVGPSSVEDLGAWFDPTDGALVVRNDMPSTAVIEVFDLLGRSLIPGTPVPAGSTVRLPLSTAGLIVLSTRTTKDVRRRPIYIAPNNH